MMKQKGRCQCGAVTFDVEAEPQLVGHCYCRDCQKSSGAGHVSYVFLAADGVRIEGETHSFESNSNSGATMTRHFCPTCGSRLFGRSSNLPEMIGITLVSFDDPDAFLPTLSIYTTRRCQWDDLPDATTTFDEGLPLTVED